jgi:hypothetical protein
MVSEKSRANSGRSEHVDEAARERRARELRSRAASIVQIDDSELPQSVKDVLQGRLADEDTR